MDVLPAVPLPFSDADGPTLFDIWRRAADDLLTTADEAGPDAWTLPTPCPGWTVGDIVAHVSSIERFLLGRADPEHVPDYDSLPHAQQGLSRITEIPVDLRRSRGRDEVLAEYRETIVARSQALASGPHDLTAMTLGVFGKPVPLDTVLRMRIFDTWVHEQDIRTAVGVTGDLDTPPAYVSATSMVQGAAFVWVKRVGAPDGSAARLVSTGPGVSFDLAVGNVDGRGVPVTAADPATTLTVSFPDFVALCAGRVPAETGAAAVAISGDRELGAALATQLNVAP